MVEDDRNILHAVLDLINLLCLMVKYNFYRGHPIVFELLLFCLVKYKYTARLIFDLIFEPSNDE